jgi:hypothetical protein
MAPGDEADDLASMWCSRSPWYSILGRTLAPHVEADAPIKTATRILVLLTGTRWDDEPLPYPRLRRLYYGQVAATKAIVSPLTPDEQTVWIECQFRTWAPERIIRYYENAALQWKVDHAPKLAKAT